MLQDEFNTVPKPSSVGNSTISEKINDIKDQTKETIHSGKEALEDVKDKFRDRSKEMYTKAHDYAKTNPMQTVGLAALTGVLVGWAIACLSHHKHRNQ